MPHDVSDALAVAGKALSRDNMLCDWGSAGLEPPGRVGQTSADLKYSNDNGDHYEPW